MNELRPEKETSFQGVNKNARIDANRYFPCGENNRLLILEYRIVKTSKD